MAVKIAHKLKEKQHSIRTSPEDYTSAPEQRNKNLNDSAVSRVLVNKSKWWWLTFPSGVNSGEQWQALDEYWHHKWAVSAQGDRWHINITESCTGETSARLIESTEQQTWHFGLWLKKGFWGYHLFRQPLWFHRFHFCNTVKKLKELNGLICQN